MKISIRDIAIGILALVLAFGLFEYHQESLQLQAMNITVKTQQATINDLKNAMEARNKKLDETIAELEKTRQKVKTPTQAVAEIPNYLPPLPIPTHVNTIPSPTNPQLQVPDSITIPHEDFQALLNYEITAKENAAKLAVAQQDIIDLQKQVVALTKQRDAAVQAAKGGTFWHRLKHTMKVAAIGAVVGAILVVVH
jgi:hypothetical protein